MTKTLEHEILKVVACESTSTWAFLCHDKKTFTLRSRSFQELSACGDSPPHSTRDPRSYDPVEAVASENSCCLPNQGELKELVLNRQFALLAQRYSPDYHLRFYSLMDEVEENHGTLLFIESRLTVNLSSEQALRTHQAAQQIASLSPRETEVLTMVVSGMTNQAIAINLGLSPKTIEKHRKKMMTKLQVQSVAEASRIAFDAELFELLLEAQQEHEEAPL